MWIPCLGDIFFVIQPFCCVRSLLLHRERQTDVCQNENCSWGACLWNIQIRPRHRCLRYCVISNSADDSVYFGVWIRLRVLVLNMRIGKIFDLQGFVDVENKTLVVQSKDNYDQMRLWHKTFKYRGDGQKKNKTRPFTPIDLLLLHLFFSSPHNQQNWTKFLLLDLHTQGDWCSPNKQISTGILLQAESICSCDCFGQINSYFRFWWVSVHCDDLSVLF